MVAFDQKVDDWKVVAVGPEARTPPPCRTSSRSSRTSRPSRRRTRGISGLGQRPRRLPQARADAHGARERRQGARRPAADRRQVRCVPGEGARAQEDRGRREDRRREGEAQRALSVGQAEDLETLTGEVLSKSVDVNLTIGGEVKPYLMTLRSTSSPAAPGRGWSRAGWCRAWCRKASGAALRADPLSVVGFRSAGPASGPPRDGPRRLSSCSQTEKEERVKVRPPPLRAGQTTSSPRSGRPASWRPPRGTTR